MGTDIGGYRYGLPGRYPWVYLCHCLFGCELIVVVDGCCRHPLLFVGSGHALWSSCAHVLWFFHVCWL